MLQSDLFVARIRRSYARFVHSEEIFFNERNISFPFPFYYFANDTTVARALQEDEIKNDFFFCPRNVFPSSLPPHVSHRTRRNNCAGKTGNNSFLRTSLSANFHPTARTGPFSWNTATNLPEHQVKIKPPNCLIHDCSVDPPSSSIFYSIKRQAL